MPGCVHFAFRCGRECAVCTFIALTSKILYKQQKQVHTSMINRMAMSAKLKNNSKANNIWLLEFEWGQAEEQRAPFDSDFPLFIPYIHARRSIHAQTNCGAITHSVTFLDIHLLFVEMVKQQRTALSFTPLNYDVVIISVRSDYFFSIELRKTISLLPFLVS